MASIERAAHRGTATGSRREGSSGRYSRLKDLAHKGLRYVAAGVEHPLEFPLLCSLGVRGVHLGEFLKLNQPWLKMAQIRTIIDVGAHTGEFASASRAIFPSAQIYSFEALPDCYQKLNQKFRGCELVQGFGVALGERCGTVKFWRSNFTKSSSVLPMGPLHKSAFPWTAETVPLEVEMRTLDYYLGQMNLTPKVLLKLDVQGYEAHVLRGGPEVLRQVDYALAEVSFEPLYEGQSLFDDIYRLFKQVGFSYAGCMEQLTSPADGRVLQADALFVRKP